MKKIIYYMLLLLIVLSLFGCKKKSASNDEGVIKEYVTDDIQGETSTPLPTDVVPGQEQAVEVIEDTSHEGEMRSSLTGLWVPEKIGKKRPYAFVFNNFKIVSNQSGIGQADIVYEALVEGGITRLLGIGENYTGDRIGSTRSARHYFVSIADEYDAIYIHYGATKYAEAKFKELGMDHMDGTSGIGTTVFYRDKSIKAPHNAFASIKGILAGIKSKGFETMHAEGYESHFTFYDKDTDLTAGSSANKITINFSSYTRPYLEYNATDKLYYQFQFGGPHKDTLTGKQLSFKNVIVEFVKEWNIDKNGYQTMDFTDASGTGYYFTNGKMAPITWKKKEATKWMRYYDESGKELTINPGKTYIAVFPRNQSEDVVIEK